MKKWLNLLNAGLYATTGGLWLINALRKDSVFNLFLALVWLTGAVIWIWRYRIERKESKKEK